MSRKRARFSWSVGFLKSLFVALIIAGVAWTANQKKEASPVASAKAEEVVPQEAAASSTVVLFGVPAPSGKSDKLFSVDMPDGVVKEREVAAGWRLTQMTKVPLTIQASGKNDGGFALIGPDWNVPLRTKSAAPYQEVAWLGMWDASHAALTAQNSDRVLLSVSRLGETREVYKIPEDVNLLGFQEKSVWFATFQPGEGMESPPQGPSDLIRVEPNGVATVMVTALQIVTSVAVGPAHVFAYQTESGDAIAQSGSFHWTGQGRPLLWLDDHRLLFAKGTIVSIVDLMTNAIQAAATLPLAPSVAQLEP